MGELTPALAALAERLGRATGPAGARAGLGGGAPVGTTSGLGAATRNECAAIEEQGALVDLAGILAMPLDQFAREGQLLEVRVPWLDVTLWLVPDEADAEALGWEGVSRGRVWTGRELMEVMTLSGNTSRGLRTVALAKLAIDGPVVEVRRREDAPALPEGVSSAPAP